MDKSHHYCVKLLTVYYKARFEACSWLSRRWEHLVLEYPDHIIGSLLSWFTLSLVILTHFGSWYGCITTFQLILLMELCSLCARTTSNLSESNRTFAGLDQLFELQNSFNLMLVYHENIDRSTFVNAGCNHILRLLSWCCGIQQAKLYLDKRNNDR